MVIVLALLSGCKTGLELDRLPLDDKILQDAREAFFESDRTGIVNDYAQVDIGEKTSDGFTITENTDADTIMNQATSEKKRLFIQLPSGEARRDHILRAIAAASIREDLKKGDKWNIIVLNTKAIKSEIATFAFDDSKAKEYYLSIAKKLNRKLGDNDILVVDIDDFAYGLTADEFFAVLSTPHVVALSKASVDSIKFFEDKQVSDEFLSKGLNPGHVYKLAKLRMLRSKNVIKNDDQEKISLIIAKVVTAIEPNGNLGSLAKFFTLIDPIVDGPTPITDLDKTIMKALASFFQANYDFLVELQLENKALTQIHEEVKQNTLAFNEQARKTDEILQGMKKILKSKLAVLADLIEKGFDTTFRNFRRSFSQFEDLRGQILPELERNLIDDAERNREDILGNAKRTSEAAISRLTEEGKARHGETTREVIKRVGALIDIVENQIVERAREHMEVITGSFFDNVKVVLRKLQAEATAATSKAARDVNDTTMKLLKNAIGELSDHTTAIGKTTEGAVNDSLVRAGDEIKSHGRLMSARVTNDVTKFVNDRIAKAQTEMTRSTANAVSESEAAVSRALSMEASDVRDLVLQTAKRIIAENKNALGSVNTSINQHVDAVMKRAERVLADALSQTEDELKRKMIAEHDTTRTDLSSHTARTSSRATTTLSGQTTAEHDVTRKNVARAVAKTVDDARTGIEHALNQESQEIKDVVNDAVTRAIKKIIADTQSGTDYLRNDIYVHTTGAIKRSQNILADALLKAEEEIKRRVSEDGQATRDDTKNVVSKETTRASRKAVEDLRAAIAAAQKRIMAQNGDVASDAQEALDKIIGRQTEDTQALMRELVLFAIKRITNDNRAAVSGLSDGIIIHTTDMVKKAQRILVDALSEAEAAIKKRVDDEGIAARNEVTSDVTKRVTNAANNVIAELRRHVDEAQKRLASHTTGTVGDAQDAVVKSQRDTTEEVKDLVSDSLARAIKKIISENRGAVTGLSDGINLHTTSAVKRAQRLLADALAEAEDAIKKRVDAEGLAARHEVTSDVTKRVGSSAVDVIAQLRKYIDDGQRRLSAHTTSTVGGAQDAIEKGQRDYADDIKTLVSDIVASAIKKIVAENRGAVTGLSEGINVHTTGAVKKAQRLLVDALVQAEEEIKKRVEAEGLAARNEVTSDVAKRVTASTAGMIADSTKDITTEVTGAMKRARDAVIDRVGETEGEVTKRIGEDGVETRERLLVGVAKETQRAQRALVDRLSEEHRSTQRKIIRHGHEVAEATREEITSEVKNQAQEIIERLQERIRSAMNKLILGNAENTEAIQIITQAALKKDGRMTRDDIAVAMGELKSTLVEEISQSIDEIRRLPRENRKHTAEVFARFIARNFAVSESYDIIRNPNNIEQVKRDVLTSLGAQRKTFEFFNPAVFGGVFGGGAYPGGETNVHRKYDRTGGLAAQEWNRFVREFREHLAAGIHLAPNPDIPLRDLEGFEEKSDLETKPIGSENSDIKSDQSLEFSHERVNELEVHEE